MRQPIKIYVNPTNQSFRNTLVYGGSVLAELETESKLEIGEINRLFVEKPQLFKFGPAVKNYVKDLTS